MGLFMILLSTAEDVSLSNGETPRFQSGPVLQEKPNLSYLLQLLTRNFHCGEEALPSRGCRRVVTLGQTSHGSSDKTGLSVYSMSCVCALRTLSEDFSELSLGSAALSQQMDSRSSDIKPHPGRPFFEKVV